MLEYEIIASNFPIELRSFKKNIIREYLQYKTLEIIYRSKYANKFVFIGGTCLHIIYGNNRFSEDLDFDIFDLTEEEFILVRDNIVRSFKLEGLDVEVSYNNSNYYHLKLKFNGVLQNFNITGHREEKLILKIDSELQNYKYPKKIYLLNKFDVFINIIVAPESFLLSRKIKTVFDRVRPLGRDFYDIVFLMSKTEPDMDYINDVMGIDNKEELLKKIIEHCKAFDFDKLAKDVQPFLYKLEDSSRVKYFLDYLKQ
jgi:predicted nucleotidyltransferase component of viral defense system